MVTTPAHKPLRWRRRGRELARLGVDQDLRLRVRGDDDNDGDVSSDDEDDIPSPKVNAAAGDSDAEDSPSPTTTVFPPPPPPPTTISTTLSTTTSLLPPRPPPPPPPPPPTTTSSTEPPPPVLAPAVSETTTSTSSTSSTLLLTTTTSSLSSSSSSASVVSSTRSTPPPVVTVTPPAQTTTSIVSTSPSEPPLVFSSEPRTTLTTIDPQTPKDEPTSSSSTTLPSTSLASETAKVSKEAQTSIGGQGVSRERPPGGPPGSMKVGIAFGTIAAISLVVGILWGAYLIKKRRRRRNKGERLPDERSYPDSSGSISSGDGEQGTASSWPVAGMMAVPNVKRSNESILNEVQQAAYGSYNSSGGREPARQLSIAELPATPFGQTIPRGFDEKLHDPSYPLPVLSPSRVEQPSLRKSIASWLRRTSRHHPLRLNPLGGRSNRTSMASSVATSSHGDDAVYQSPNPGHGDVPPLPAVPGALTQPAPVFFSKDDAEAYYRRLQNGSQPTLVPSVTDVSSEYATVQEVSPVDSRGSERTRGQEQSIYSLYANSDMDEKAYPR